MLRVCRRRRQGFLRINPSSCARAIQLPASGRYPESFPPPIPFARDCPGRCAHSPVSVGTAACSPARAGCAADTGSDRFIRRCTHPSTLFPLQPMFHPHLQMHPAAACLRSRTLLRGFLFHQNAAHRVILPPVHIAKFRVPLRRVPDDVAPLLASILALVNVFTSACHHNSPSFVLLFCEKLPEI